MRNVLCQSLLGQIADPAFVFLTGDLGFQALEPLRDAAAGRFINAGVAEQNMVSVAAGLAWSGLKSWVYSIAPFVYARPYEQIRNDVCMHDLPVKLVGNGGGYGYGVMGATHHALADYGALLCLEPMQVFVPAFAADVPPIIRRLGEFSHPAYLRLGRCELPAGYGLPVYSAWRQLLEGGGTALAVVGPLAGGILGAVSRLRVARRPNLWVITELPIRAGEIPPAFLSQVQSAGHLLVVEEHVAQGSVGQMLAHALVGLGKAPRRFTHRCALGYPTRSYGSQTFHRRECGLDPESILAELQS
ncbi:MAG: transketolase [Pirellulales bacterium]|nr:transketolase [Pirellulales bacterium]